MDSLWRHKHMDLNKIQIAPTRLIEDAVVIWPHEGQEVDLVADPRAYGGLKLRSGSVKVIYSVGLLGKTDFNKIDDVLKDLVKTLAIDGQLYIIENDFEYFNRAVLGGDLSLEQFNSEFIQQSYLSQNIIIDKLERLGFKNENMKIWFEFPGMKFKRKDYQFIISAIKK